jgi:hypothetical protein
MDMREIKETSIWGLYEIGRNYHRLKGVYTDTDRNYRFYNGNQWEGAKLGGVEPVQKNFIKPIVKYKCAVIHDNLYAINYSSMNYENREFRPTAERFCGLLNRYAAKVWEQDKMDFKGRRVTKDAAINDEGIIYVNFDKENMTPVNEIIKKNDVYYGNENDDDIQNQPYILIRKRMPVVNAIEFALREGMSEADRELIIGDNDTFDESGEAAKQEVDNMVTIVYKMYKENGTVHYSVATRLVTIVDDVDLGISFYPVAHFNWEEKEGSARGEGEVRYLIPNQIEVNRTEMRRVLTVKNQAYPIKVVDVSKVANPNEMDTVGGMIRTNGQPVDDVHKIVGTIPPAQMSPDVKELQADLIQVTRDLAGAGDTATGQVNPEAASGRAILAVQQASQAPMTEQKETYKNFIEDLAKIWLEYLIIHSENGVSLEEETKDPMTGEDTVQIVNVPQSALEQLKATVKIDVTPKGVYDKFAQEQTLENLLMNGLFNAQRLAEFEAYVDALDDDSVAPKQKLEGIIKHMKEEQQKIAQINAQAQLMKQRASQFLMGDPEEQSSMMADAMSQLQQQEQGFADQEAMLDEQVEVPAESEEV